MELGVVLPQTEIGPDPADIVRFVEAAEAAGLAHVVVYDHVVGADRSTRPDWPGPYDLHSSFHEPFVLYGFLAADTRMELVTGVVILPQRQAVLVAKQAAEVDVLTNGKFRLGVGIGWNPVEYDALGLDFRNRATRYEEQIEVMRLLWTHESVTFEGRYHSIDHAGLLPRPVQQPIPLWMGGGLAPKTLDRIGRLADGWICNTPPGHGLEEAVEVVRGAGRRRGTRCRRGRTARHRAAARCGRRHGGPAPAGRQMGGDRRHARVGQRPLRRAVPERTRRVRHGGSTGAARLTRHGPTRQGPRRQGADRGIGLLPKGGNHPFG